MKKKLAVFSHHRSGTHFLMKSLALNSSYKDSSEFLIDVNLGIDLWNPFHIRAFFENLKAREVDAIGKSHFEASFFRETMDLILEQTEVVYIVRRPENALKSYFDMSQKLKWNEAPDTEDVNGFVQAEPSGSCLRWQSHQYETMTHRWQAHVSGWLDLIAEYPSLHVVTYENLKDDYQNTMIRLSQRLGWHAAPDFVKPESTGIFPGQGGDYRDQYSPEIITWIADICDETYAKAKAASEKI